MLSIYLAFMNSGMHEEEGEEGEAAREQRVRSHSARATILTLLAKDGRELTAPQIKAELSERLTLRDLYYHLRVLEVSHLLKRDGSRYKLDS